MMDAEETESAGSVWQTILETKREARDVRQGNYTLFHAWCWLDVSNMKT